LDDAKNPDFGFGAGVVFILVHPVCKSLGQIRRSGKENMGQPTNRVRLESGP